MLWSRKTDRAGHGHGPCAGGQGEPVTDDDIAAWFDKLTGDQPALALHLRTLVRTRAPDLREELKWGQPRCFAQSLVCDIQKATGHASLGFGKGAALPDPEVLLHGGGGRMRPVKFPRGTAPDLESLGRLIDAARALDSAR